MKDSEEKLPIAPSHADYENCEEVKMKYEIVEVKLKYSPNGNLEEVITVWKDKDQLRGTYANKRITSGYMMLKNMDTPSMELFQSVAGYGIYLDYTRKKMFPHIENWSR